MDSFSIIFFIIIMVSVFSLGVYFIVLFLYPEWIGISGKSAKKIDEELKDQTQIDLSNSSSQNSSSQKASTTNSNSDDTSN